MTVITYLYSENSVDVEKFTDSLNRDDFNVAIVNVPHFNTVCIDDVENLSPIEQLVHGEPHGTYHTYTNNNHKNTTTTRITTTIPNRTKTKVIWLKAELLASIRQMSVELSFTIWSKCE